MCIVQPAKLPCLQVFPSSLSTNTFPSKVNPLNSSESKAAHSRSYTPPLSPSPSSPSLLSLPISPQPFISLRLTPNHKLRTHQLIHIRPLNLRIPPPFLLQQHSQDLDRWIETEFLRARPALRAGDAYCWLWGVLVPFPLKDCILFYKKKKRKERRGERK